MLRGRVLWRGLYCNHPATVTSGDGPVLARARLADPLGVHAAGPGLQRPALRARAVDWRCTYGRRDRDRPGTVRLLASGFERPGSAVPGGRCGALVGLL